MAQVAPLFSTNAADRTECYNLIAFGSQNCCVYCDSFPREDGRYQLTQLFDSSDRLSCEWCDKERGVCKQARDAAGDLAAHLKADGFDMTVVGLPKTVDNDIRPIRQSLGALTAAQVGARFFDHVSNEQSATPNTFVVHEVMGRHCGWLTAATLRAYNERIEGRTYCEGLMMNHALKDVEAVYVPEMPFDIESETERLSRAMRDTGYATIFVSEGACVDEIMSEREAGGETLERDAFGHVRLDSVNVGDWFARRFAKAIGADKTLVQKSGYYARSAPANPDDLHLIKGMADHAVTSALEGVSGVVGHDEDHGLGGRGRSCWM